ncbi:MAG: hypothetical protein HY908_01950 [Myxococcales bacterium]|nr:hypothetical protein [Myxococcales bacterium]
MACRPIELALAAALLALGCQPKIGDECGSATDCSAMGDRMCDVTQPGGYCTLFNCEPGTCPAESACVLFQSELDPSCGALDDMRMGRFARTFCMRVCTAASDCRDGYQCVTPRDAQARVVDKSTDTDDPQDTQVCLVAGSPPQGTSAGAGVCGPADGGTLPPPWDGGTSTGGTGGAATGGTGGTPTGGAAGAGG